MSFELDEDILQDFLVEAGEILELLSEQLVELEKRPQDSDLLNAIFRGFHTVKGGAGFLGLSNLVDVCHGAENVFDLLRNGQRHVNAELMDVVLAALDTINEMFALIQERIIPGPADETLLAGLHRLCEEEQAQASAPAAAVEAPAEPEAMPVDPSEVSSGGIDEITDAEFEALLDELHGSSKGPSSAEAAPATPAAEAPSSAPSSDEITDDEFEALLDQLHGKGQFGGAVDDKATEAPAEAPKAEDKATAAKGGGDLINDDEFEALLDQLHGKGKGPSVDTPAPARADKAPAPVAKADTPAPAGVASPPPETTVRVDTKKLDEIMNMVGELVLVRNRLLSIGLNADDDELSKAVANLDVVTGDLQGAVMQTRMQPIKKVFGRFPRVVRDLARSLKKDINLELVGEETDLDKNLVEALADPLVHLVRNAVDHGIEMPDARASSGKPRNGTIVLSASQEGDHILLSITDDGAGMDPEKLKAIAIERGVLDQDAAARMSDEEAYNLIFAPGFSTKKEISDISGRGVGMDVVKTKISQLNGSIHIDSAKGEGTRLTIKVPLTLAILPTLMVLVGKQTFAFPLATVNEIFHLDLSNTNVVDGQLTVIVRDKAIPLFYLDSWLVRGSLRERRKGQGHVVIIQQGSMQVGFVVDGLIGQEEVVIKPLGQMLQGTPGMAGATITSDGGIALILDVPALLKRYARKM
ncbi:chemotaxis protein CheA [Gallaecimonas kandeliae]|uniref:chemotaxis protein CheA n=1 Tax=Gallaecimonas kandeliae TaxID=3029055 RepID=UPI00264A081D|nr:chemotaxis protein CheA [Gallaecimonas kandeliae]WKE66758.1 chemotaxis protein CheA [Gallaecimonas kandeliae]